MVGLFEDTDVNKQGYIYTDQELAFSQGWPTLVFEEDNTNTKMRAAMGFDFDSIPAASRKTLLGNAMHLGSLSAFLLYVFAHVIRRDTVLEFLPDLRLLHVPKKRLLAVQESTETVKSSCCGDSDIAGGDAPPVSHKKARSEEAGCDLKLPSDDMDGEGEGV